MGFGIVTRASIRNWNSKSVALMARGNRARYVFLAGRMAWDTETSAPADLVSDLER